MLLVLIGFENRNISYESAAYSVWHSLALQHSNDECVNYCFCETKLNGKNNAARGSMLNKNDRLLKIYGIEVE